MGLGSHQKTSNESLGAGGLPVPSRKSQITFCMLRGNPFRVTCWESNVPGAPACCCLVDHRPEGAKSGRWGDRATGNPNNAVTASSQKGWDSVAESVLTSDYPLFPSLPFALRRPNPTLSPSVIRLQISFGRRASPYFPALTNVRFDFLGRGGATTRTADGC